MKYYPISKLQANTPEVGEILNLLQPLSTSSAEFDDMKISLIIFMKSLRSDLGVEVEERYVDKVYRDSYYSYYDTRDYLIVDIVFDCRFLTRRLIKMLI